MSRLLKSRDYLVKCLGFILLLGFISLGVIGGCGNNGGDGTGALTENDFANDPGLTADPEKHLIVKFLEHPDSEETENDTGEVGNDVIPYTYTRTINHTFCFEDENDDSEHFMILLNSDGEEVLRVLANGDCITEVIEAGEYEMVLTHGGHVEETETIFLIPDPEDEQITKRDGFDQKEFKTSSDFSYKMHRYLPGGLVKYFERISNVFTRRARAQTVSINNTTRLINNACVGCNLTNVDLTDADLTGAGLTDADLTGAILTGADLSGAILTRAILTGVILGDTMFDNAAWCDGNCMCGTNSIDTCVGCDSIDTCTALNACELECDDGISCTVDSCDPAAGCQHVLDLTDCPVTDNECLAPACLVGGGCGTMIRPDGTACMLADGQAGECLQGWCNITQEECLHNCDTAYEDFSEECSKPDATPEIAQCQTDVEACFDTAGAIFGDSRCFVDCTEFGTPFLQYQCCGVKSCTTDCFFNIAVCNTAHSNCLSGTDCITEKQEQCKDSCDPAITDNECLAPACLVGGGCGTMIRPDGTACMLADGQAGECLQGWCNITQEECLHNCDTAYEDFSEECSKPDATPETAQCQTDVEACFDTAGAIFGDSRCFVDCTEFGTPFLQYQCCGVKSCTTDCFFNIAVCNTAHSNCLSGTDCITEKQEQCKEVCN